MRESPLLLRPLLLALASYHLPCPSRPEALCHLLLVVEALAGAAGSDARAAGEADLLLSVGGAAAVRGAGMVTSEEEEEAGGGSATATGFCCCRFGNWILPV